MSSRRKFLTQSLSALGVLAFAAKAKAESAQCEPDGYRLSEQYQDTSVPWFGVNKITIAAQDILVAREVRGLIASEGSHQHDLNISAEQMAQLKAGQTITVRTEVALGHQHTLTINPADVVPGGKIIRVFATESPS